MVTSSPRRTDDGRRTLHEGGHDGRLHEADGGMDDLQHSSGLHDLQVRFNICVERFKATRPMDVRNDCTTDSVGE